MRRRIRVGKVPNNVDIPFHVWYLYHSSRYIWCKVCIGIYLESQITRVFCLYFRITAFTQTCAQLNLFKFDLMYDLSSSYLNFKLYPGIRDINVNKTDRCF